jgi:purine nucleosidase
MRRLKQICTVAVVTLALLCAGDVARAQQRAAVLLDTDIGTGIDDAFALGLALGSYELHVRGMTAVGADTHKRAMMLCRLLTVTGRRHTRVAEGSGPQPERPITDQYKYYYHPDVLFDRTTKPEKQPAADFLHGRLKQRPGEVTLIALGPLTNVARLIESHDDAPSLIKRIVLLESNLSLDAEAAQKVFTSGVPLVVVPQSVCRDLTLDDAGVQAVFSPGTPLTRQVQTMYQMWDRRRPPLGEALAVALCIDEELAEMESQALRVDGKGVLKRGDGKPNARIAASVDGAAFINWYTRRMSSLLAAQDNPSRVLPLGPMPHRVHVAEDFDNDIERFWWMSGKPETKILPTGSSRACRGVLTHDFDDLLMVSRRMYSAVIFNPVPGPPMGKNTRLSFRYRLSGADTIRVQIYSLTNGYHRQLVVKDLPQREWRQATVDMTQARRPDGTGGPLGENERIDDIQFYVDPDAELLIDDIVLYDAAVEGEQRPFPKRILFTGLFDTGKQGQHWPGDFEIVADADNFWKAARSVANSKTGRPWLRIGLRGQRRLAEQTDLSFRHHLRGADALQVRLVNSQTGESLSAEAKQLEKEQWAQTTLAFQTSRLPSIDEIQFLLPKDAELLIDDLLLFEPGAK